MTENASNERRPEDPSVRQQKIGRRAMPEILLPRQSNWGRLQTYQEIGKVAGSARCGARITLIRRQPTQMAFDAFSN
jgi:hypothetical protein